MFVSVVCRVGWHERLREILPRRAFRRFQHFLSNGVVVHELVPHGIEHGEGGPPAAVMPVLAWARRYVVVSPELLRLRVDESLYFANARSLEDLVSDDYAAQPALRHVVLQCSAIDDIDASAGST